jgi:hypothetical protein
MIAVQVGSPTLPMGLPFAKTFLEPFLMGAISATHFTFAIPVFMDSDYVLL